MIREIVFAGICLMRVKHAYIKLHPIETNNDFHKIKKLKIY